MAGVINKIRTKGATILVILIGLAMGSFVLTDVLSRIADIFGLSGVADTVGVIDGEKIKYQEFGARVGEGTRFAQSNQQNATTVQVSNETWQQIVKERIMKDEYAQLGLRITEDEWADMVFGAEPDDFAMQIYGDPNTKKADRAQLQKLAQQAETDPEMRFRLNMFDKYIKDNRLNNKYTALVKGGAFVSSAEARTRYLEENRKAAVKMLVVSYAGIPDSTVKATDDDYKKVYQENINEFKQNMSEAVVKYVVFEKRATRADSITAFEYLAKLMPDFKTSTNDSLFVLDKNRSNESFGFEYQPEAGLSESVKNVIQGVPTDSVIGPFLDGNMFKIVKVAERVNRPDKPFFKLRHIFFQNKSPQDSMQNQMKAGIYRGMVNPENFAQYVQQSDDQSSKSNGGEIGWYKWGMFGKKFDEQLKGHQKSEMFVINSDYGSHIVDVMDYSTSGLRVGVIGYDIEPGKETIDNLQKQAELFRSKVSDSTTFLSVAKLQNLVVTQSQPLNPGGGYLGNLAGDNVRTIVNWALQADANDIGPKIFDVDNGLVVAVCTKNYEPGFRPLEAVRERLRDRVMAMKKKELILAKLKAQSGKDLEAMASGYGAGAYTTNAENITFASGYVAGIGVDPVLVGKIFAMKGPKLTGPLRDSTGMTTQPSGPVSKPIVGKTGVFIVQMYGFAEPDPQEGEQFEAYRKNLQSTKRSQFQTKVQQGLENNAEVRDYRYKFDF